MLQIQEKTVVCQTHKALLYLLVRYGNGALPLPLLRTLAVRMRLYPNGQAVNKAVRELREAGVLDRQTWVDNNSDLILVRKFAPCASCSTKRARKSPPHSGPAPWPPIYFRPARWIGCLAQWRKSIWIH